MKQTQFFSILSAREHRPAILFTLISGILTGALSVLIWNLTTHRVSSDSSYAIGVQIGKQMKAQEVAIHSQSLARGVDDVLSERALRLSDEQIRGEMNKLQEAAQQKIAALAEKNGKQARTFLEENGKNPGVKTEKSGWQYQVIKETQGKKPSDDDSVLIHFKGSLSNGQVFEDTYSAEPRKLKVKEVMWREALRQMSQGSKWKLWFPPELAYGPTGRMPVIPPNALLIFEIELIKIL